MVLVTSDEDWESKWQTSEATTPHFSTAPDPLPRGKKIAVLTFFSNPGLNAKSEAEVYCDLDLKRPDGSTSMHQENLECAGKGKISHPSTVFLATQNIGFVGDPPDPSGKWVATINLHDKIRNTTLNLKTFFVLK